ncbi:MAG TPA: diguanylate cyclase [Gammaproteobacteria bacterium]|nr:diguanylate cyclase [Gammaproteobacteria bacterium]
MFASYRSRLIALLTAVTGLMVLLLFVSYLSARWVIWEDASLHLQQTVQLYERNLASQRIELARYAGTLRNDRLFRDYSFAVLRIGADRQPLVGLIDDYLERMPLDAILLIWDDGLIVRGRNEGFPEREIRNYPLLRGNSTAYIETDDDVYLVAILPLVYQGEHLGRVAVAQNISNSWVTGQTRDRQTQLFVERDGRVIASTAPEFMNMSIDPESGTLVTLTDTYRLQQVGLPAAKGLRARFWIARSDTAQIETLSRYNRIMIGLALLTLALMLVAGLIAVNRFSQPIRKLISLTREMASGQLPTIKRGKGDSEIDQLLNQFIELVDALRAGREEVQKAHGKLKVSAITDDLTGLYNRRYLNEIYPKMLAQAEREGLVLSAVLLDLDYFKNINDTYGHNAGDACLVKFATLLRKNSRTSDFVFRMGGEEFLILSLGRRAENVSTLAEKILVSTEAEEVQYGGHAIHFTVSCGISCVRSSPSFHPTLSHLVSLADRALYAAKREGRNCVRMNTDGCKEAVQGEARTGS